MLEHSQPTRLINQSCTSYLNPPIMNSAIPVIDATSVGVGLYRSPRQLLAGCVLASVVLHAMVLVPGWDRPALELPVSTLEVVVVTQAPPVKAVAPLPVRPPPISKPQARPQRLAQPQPRHAEPLPTVQPAPQVLTPAIAESVPETVAVRSSFPPAIETKVPAARAELPTSPPLFSASYLRNPAPAYPVSARRNGDEGTVLLKVLVNAEGVPLQVDVDQTSGSPPLDKAALVAVRNWRFVPARRGVQNVEGWVRVPVVFRLAS